MSDAPLDWVLGAARLLPAAAAVAAIAGRAGWLAGVWLLSLLPFVQVAGVEGGLLIRLLLELAVGAGFALALCAPLWAARHAGRMLELGYGTRFGQPGALERLYGFTFLAVFAALGGLRLWSRALVELPGVGMLDATRLTALALGTGAFVTQLLRLSLLVAAPAWLAFVSLDLVLALVGRLSGEPGRAIVGLSTPLRLLSVVVALPLAVEHLPEWLRLARTAAARFAASLLS